MVASNSAQIVRGALLGRLVDREAFRRGLNAADGWLTTKVALWAAIRGCRSSHWSNAVSEFTLTLIFALLPIYVPLIALPMFGHHERGMLASLNEQVKNGELYLLSTALLAPIYYFTFPQGQNQNKRAIIIFPSQRLFVLVFIATICFSVLAVAATKVQATQNGIPQDMIAVSWWLFVVCCITFLLSIAIRNSLPELAERSLDDASRREQEDIPPRAAANGLQHEDDDELVNSVIASHSAEKFGA